MSTAPAAWASIVIDAALLVTTSCIESRTVRGSVDATIQVVPTAFAVTRPRASAVAISGSLDDQRTRVGGSAAPRAFSIRTGTVRVSPR